jgi:N-acetylmuramoyl-L-alanine amidase
LVTVPTAASPRSRSTAADQALSRLDIKLKPSAAALALISCGCMGGGPVAAATTSTAPEGTATRPSSTAGRGLPSQVPRTLARAAVVGSQPLMGPRRIDFVGVHWRGAGVGGSVRFRHDGEWTAWQPLHAGELHPPGRVASELVAAGHASAYQVRMRSGTSDVRAVAINTTDGPRQTVSAPPATAQAARALGRSLPRSRSSRACYLSRALWGADESLRLDAQGTEVWSPTFSPAQRLTIHHTATDPATEAGETDPAAIVRAIYRYHAVDLGWGDIGYQLLVDQRGCVYEGRYSGPDGLPVYGVPTASGRPEAVTAGHTLGHNVGNIGIALLGNFNELEPSRAALRSLTATLATLSTVSGLDPKGYGTYVNPINSVTKDSYVISGHRDYLVTECPGENLYARLVELREESSSLVRPDNWADLLTRAVL